jgi:hypothetical protein
MARLSMDRIDIEINKFAKSVIKRARGNLTRARRVSSKELWKSLRYRYEKGVLRFYMADYGPFIDQGVSGTGKGNYKPKKPRRVARSIHKPPFKYTKGPVGPSAERSFAGWIRNEGIVPRNELGQFVKQTESSIRSLNFLLRRSVGRFGITPTRFFSEAFDHYAPGLEKQIDFIFDKEIDRVVTEMLDVNVTNHCAR